LTFRSGPIQVSISRASEMYESQSAKIRRIYHALSLLKPYDAVGAEKVRVGRSGDGGYVLLTLPVQPSIFYSFGVGDEISFEYDLAQRGCRGYLFDHTVEDLPYQHPNLHFLKAGVGAVRDPSGPLATIEDYLNKNEDEHNRNLLLKLDVEGSEYEVLSATSDECLRQFSQFVMEVHWLHRLVDPAFCNRFTEVFERLNKMFMLCHVHANNCAPLTLTSCLPCADVLELTYVRNDLIEYVPSNTFYPTYLDCPNDPERQDFPLLFFPFYPVSAAETAGSPLATIDSSVASLEFDERLRTETSLSAHQRRVSLFGRKLLHTGNATAKVFSKPAGSGQLIASRPLNILYLACHETLEYDDVRLFTEMGHRVFSVGGLANPDAARPSTRPVMPRFYSRDWWTAFAADRGNDLLAKRITRDFAQRFDVVVVNHDPFLLDTNREAFMGMPIVFRTIGQSNDHIETALGRHLETVHIVRYSQKEVNLTNFCRTDRVIYFAKFLTDYPPWEPGTRAITFHNSFPTRATVSVPSLNQYTDLTRVEPCDLYGFLNEGVEAWRGLASAELQLELFRTAGVYLYVYSVPPSYTLSLIEAMLVGVPVIVPSAVAVRATLGDIAGLCGFSDERYEVTDLLDNDPTLIWNTIDEAPLKMRALLDDPVKAIGISERLRATAQAKFNTIKIAPQWQQLFSEIVL